MNTPEVTELMAQLDEKVRNRYLEDLERFRKAKLRLLEEIVAATDKGENA